MINLRKKPVETKNYSVQLNKNDSLLFKAFLKGLGATYETSAIYEKIHFELTLNRMELGKVASFLNEL